MEQEVVAQKILFELVESGICDEKNEEIMWNYLMQTYCAGYDRGMKVPNHSKPVGQYSLDGKLLKIFGSVTEAGKAVGAHKASISKAAIGKINTSHGFIWKYINIKPSSGIPEETIGSVKPETLQPKQKSRVSKKD